MAELPTSSQTSGAPEVVLVGRSNVGKSTLLNALLGGPRVAPARRAATSARPGETRSLAFHRLGPTHTPDLLLVDTPGYGFAFEPRDSGATGAGARAGWLATALAYVRWRGGRGGMATPDAAAASAAGLRRMLLLVDARHGLKRADRVFLDVLHARDALGEHSSAPMRAALDAAGATQRLPGWDAARKVSLARARARGLGNVTDAGDPDAHDGPLLGDLARDAPARPLVPPIQVVLTKGDLVPREDIARRAARVRDELRTIRGARTPDGLSILPVAALRGKGLFALQRDLALLCRTSIRS